MSETETGTRGLDPRTDALWARYDQVVGDTEDPLHSFVVEISLDQPILIHRRMTDDRDPFWDADPLDEFAEDRSLRLRRYPPQDIDVIAARVFAAPAETATGQLDTRRVDRLMGRLDPPREANWRWKLEAIEISAVNMLVLGSGTRDLFESINREVERLEQEEERRLLQELMDDQEIESFDEPLDGEPAPDEEDVPF